MAGSRRSAFPAPTVDDASVADEISQLLCKKLPDMLRFCGRVGSEHDLRLTPCTVLPSASLNDVDIPRVPISRLNAWPVGFPCQRFSHLLAEVTA